MPKAKGAGVGFKTQPRRSARVESTSNLLAVYRTSYMEVSLRLGEPDEDAPEGWGENLYTTININGKYVAFNLTDLTSEELHALRRIFVIATNSALAIAEARDKIAEEEEAGGNTTLTRLYRGIPNLAVREHGVQREHGACLCGGREAILFGVETGGSNSTGSDGSGGGPVGGSAPDGLGASNPQPEADQPQVSDAVGGTDGPDERVQGREATASDAASPAERQSGHARPYRKGGEGI